MAAALTLPPAPNWFSSGLISAGPSGWVAYGAKSGLVLVEARPGEEEGEGGSWRAGAREKDYPRVHLHPDAHNDRAKVTCVSWCPAPGPRVPGLASASEDGVVRRWAWDGAALSLAGQHSAHGKARVTGLSWSPADPGLLLSADDSGAVVAWDVLGNTTRNLVFGRNTIFSLAAHPADPELAAFGCKLGLVFIVSVRAGGRVLHRMRGHDEDVYAVAWSPGQGVELGGERHEGWLLASSSRDRTARLWSADSGKVVHTVRIPQQHKGGKGGPAPAFITVAWPDPGTLLTGGGQGELLAWDLARPGRKGGSEFTVLHREHFKNLFGIAVSGRVVYSVGQDRSLVALNLDTARLQYNLPCFAGFVYCIASNPIEPSILAVGAGDAQVRVWRTGGEQLFDITNVYGKLNQCKVMSLAWHPTKEGLLALGTDEGRVGWVEALGSNRMVTFSSAQHRGGVYSVSWGPAIVGEGEGVCLYSCGDGRVVQHALKSGKGVDIQERLDLANGWEGVRPAGRSQVLWLEREAGKMVLLGCDDGTVEVYRLPSLQLAATLKSQSKLIQSLALHPLHLADGTECREYSCYLASASNEHPVHVYDLGPVLAHPESGPALCIVTPAKVLAGHMQRVIEVAWSPHQAARLVSVSYDFSGQVWDVAKAEPLHNFRGHGGRLMCCLWHPARDLVLTGGEEGVLHGWEPDTMPDTVPAERRREKRGRSWKPEGVVDATDAKDAKDAREAGKEDTKAIDLEEPKAELSFDELLAKHRADQAKSKVVVNGGQEPSATAIDTTKEATQDSRVKKTARRDYKKSTFPISSATEVKNRSKVGEECVLIHQINQKTAEGSAGGAGEETSTTDTVTAGLAGLTLEPDAALHLALFTTGRAPMLRLLDAETAALAEEPELASQLALWSGDLAGAVEAAMSEGRMTERLVALAAGTSTALWRRAARALGAQLARSGEAARGAELLVAAGAVREAVAELSRAGQHRAALAVARSRLPAADPAPAEVLSAWARQSAADGNFALAARCWTGAGEPARAAEQLARLGDRHSLRAAALLAGGEGRGAVYARQALTDSLHSGDLGAARRLVGEQEGLRWAAPLVAVQGALAAGLKGGAAVGEGGLLEGVRDLLRQGLVQVVEGWREETAAFLASSSQGEEERMVLLQVAGLLTGCLPPAAPQPALAAAARALALLHPRPSLLAALLPALLPAGAQPPAAGRALLGAPLDWQCNWPELRSLQASEGLLQLGGLEGDADKAATEEELELLADCFMLEDVARGQRLRAEIAEGEAAVEAFQPEAGAAVVEEEVNGGEEGEETTGLDLTPSLLGPQTLALTGPGGEWTSQGVAGAAPLPGPPGTALLPPPARPSQSFQQRFLAGRASTEQAVKELQKLRWTLDRSCPSLDPPFPCLSLLCSRLLALAATRGLGAAPAGQAPDEQEAGRLGLRQRVARWGYYHGLRALQEVFLQYA